MQVQKTDNTSFKQFRYDLKGKVALTTLVAGTKKEAKQGLEIMLKSFKNRGDEFAKILDSSPKTQGIDIVISQEADDATGWKDIPTILMKKGNSQVEGTNRLYLDELLPKFSERAIPEMLDFSDFPPRSMDLANKFENWFVKNYANLTQPKIVEKETPASEFIKRIFG